MADAIEVDFLGARRSFELLEQYQNGHGQLVRRYGCNREQQASDRETFGSTMDFYEIIGERFSLDFLNHDGNGPTADDAAADLELKLKPLAKLLAPLVEVEG